MGLGGLTFFLLIKHEFFVDSVRRVRRVSSVSRKAKCVLCKYKVIMGIVSRVRRVSTVSWKAL